MAHTKNFAARVFALVSEPKFLHRNRENLKIDQKLNDIEIRIQKSGDYSAKYLIRKKSVNFILRNLSGVRGRVRC